MLRLTTDSAPQLVDVGPTTKFGLVPQFSLLGLLQHHLGHEDPPRIPFTAPRQIAQVGSAPGEDRPRVDHAIVPPAVQSAQTSVPSYGRLRSGANSRFQINTLRVK